MGLIKVEVSAEWHHKTGGTPVLIKSYWRVLIIENG